MKNSEKLWRSSDESDKSMDLVKSTQSEDLSKDLQGNPRISPPKCEDLMMNWMKRVENWDEIRYRSWPQICIQIYVVFWDYSQKHHLQWQWDNSEEIV